MAADYSGNRVACDSDVPFPGPFLLPESPLPSGICC